MVDTYKNSGDDHPRPTSSRFSTFTLTPDRLTLHSASKEKLNEYREIFNLVDRDGGGTINKEELKELMETLGVKASEEEVEEMVNEIDDNNTGEIDFDEFASVMNRKIPCIYSADEVKSAFKVFEDDENKKGFISVENVVEALSEYADKRMTDDKLRDLVVKQLDSNSENKQLINYEEFVDMMMDE